MPFGDQRNYVLKQCPNPSTNLPKSSRNGTEIHEKSWKWCLGRFGRPWGRQAAPRPPKVSCTTTFETLFCPLGCHFGSIWEPCGIQSPPPNRLFEHKIDIRGSKMVFQRGVEKKVRKLRGNRVSKWVIFGRLEPRKSCSRVGAVHILLKRVVAEIITKKVRNESPNCSQNEPKIVPQRVLGCYFVILECFFWDAGFAWFLVVEPRGGPNAQSRSAWRCGRWTAWVFD